MSLVFISILKLCEIIIDRAQREPERGMARRIMCLIKGNNFDID